MTRTRLSERDRRGHVVEEIPLRVFGCRVAVEEEDGRVMGEEEDAY